VLSGAHHSFDHLIVQVGAEERFNIRLQGLLHLCRQTQNVRLQLRNDIRNALWLYLDWTLKIDFMPASLRLNEDPEL
jgi:hypothetical protein